MATTRSKAFTLVELLIVVVILGIVAAITLPQFSNASANARASMLRDDLRIMRTQIMVFKGQHASVAPGYPGGDTTQAPAEDAFVTQLTSASKADCQTAAPGTAGYIYGPYFSRMPENPINGKSTVQVLADGAAVPSQADDSHGWIYQADTLIFKADCTGADQTGMKYFEY